MLLFIVVVLTVQPKQLWLLEFTQDWPCPIASKWWSGDSVLTLTSSSLSPRASDSLILEVFLEAQGDSLPPVRKNLVITGALWV